MTDEEIIETAMHVYDSQRDAIRWAIKQVRMQSNTHKSDPVSRQLVSALRMVLDDPNALDGRPRTYECCMYALAAAKEAGL
jgi:hypothetical protein